ncbi:MAG: NAD(P)/FAD-dependent oxidoreductase [Acidiferrobacterales bacterium]
MKSFDVIILGAGAAGLMCAFTAANRGRSVLLLECSNKVGKKILMSGGGRCNFTNLYATAENFLSQNPHYCKSALSRYTPDDFVKLVQRHGIAFHEKAHGQLFCDESSKEILAMMLDECHRVGVEIRTSIAIGQVGFDGQFVVRIGHDDLASQKLVIATGGLSIPTLGGSGFGYELAQQFGMRIVPQHAALVPFVFTDSFGELCQQLAGVSLPVRLSCGNVSFTDDLLFTHRGLSGPAALQLSSYWQPGQGIKIEMMPDQDVLELMAKYKKVHPKSLLRTFFSQHLPKKLAVMLEQLWWQDLAEITMANIPEKRLRELAQQSQAWSIKPSGTEGYRTAEVTSGGVDTRDLDSKTMESKTRPGLYFIGEVVDVTGELGGYNFQWAWASGFVAGVSV